MSSPSTPPHRASDADTNSDADSKKREPRGDPQETAPLTETQLYALDILSKKYHLYDWCEDKISTLVTIDGLLIGGLLLVINLREITGWARLASFSLSLALLMGSILISLWHVIPVMYSGRSSRRNPRTVVGTEAYSTNLEYARAVMRLSLKDMIAVDLDQIRGMNKNIMRNQRAIRIAVRLTMAALVPLAMLIGLVVGQPGGVRW